MAQTGAKLQTAPSLNCYTFAMNLNDATNIATLISILIGLPFGVFRIWRRLDHRLGEQDARLIRIESQFHRNGGSSLRDSIDRIDRDVAKLTGRFDQHIEEAND
jgi:hypothetical protein